MSPTFGRHLWPISGNRELTKMRSQVSPDTLHMILCTDNVTSSAEILGAVDDIEHTTALPYLQGSHEVCNSNTNNCPTCPVLSPILPLEGCMRNLVVNISELWVFAFDRHEWMKMNRHHHSPYLASPARCLPQVPASSVSAAQVPYPAPRYPPDT
jgi:hypothetical protein